jgi:hypothetical protein
MLCFLVAKFMYFLFCFFFFLVSFFTLLYQYVFSVSNTKRLDEVVLRYRFLPLLQLWLLLFQKVR